MADYDYDIGIIGGGAAGLTVASGAAQLGAKTLLVEKEEALGGDCLHYGCVPSKTLIKTAHVYHLMKNGPKFGLPAIAPPAVDFREVSKRIRSVIGVIQKHDSVERFCKLGAQVEFGNPEFTDEHAISLNGKFISARTWVIATGSSSAVPPVEGLDKTPYLTNRDLFYLDKLPGSMIVLGAGPIATEMAQAFCRLGTKVTVIQRSGQILSKEDKDMADIVKQMLEEEGVALMEHFAGLPFHVNYNVIPSVVYTNPEVASVGFTEEELKASGVPYKAGKFPFSANSRAKAVGSYDGFAKVLADPNTDKVLGVHIIGEMAGTMIAEAATIMEFGGSSEDIARTCHAHPTHNEALKEAAWATFGKAFHV